MGVLVPLVYGLNSVKWGGVLNHFCDMDPFEILRETHEPLIRKNVFNPIK